MKSKILALSKNEEFKNLLKKKKVSNMYVTIFYGILENKNNTTIYLLPTKNGVPQKQKKLSEQAWVMRRDGDMLSIPRWTAHDLRRTVRTQLSRLGCPSIVGEAVLGHSKKGMMGVYDLHQYEGECSVWLQKLADHYDTLGKTERKYHNDFEEDVILS